MADFPLVKLWAISIIELMKEEKMANWILLILVFTSCGGGWNDVTIHETNFNTEIACEVARTKMEKWERNGLRTVCVETSIYKEAK